MIFWLMLSVCPASFANKGVVGVTGGGRGIALCPECADLLIHTDRTRVGVRVGVRRRGRGRGGGQTCCSAVHDRAT